MQNEMNSSLTKPMSSWLQHQNLLNVNHSFHFFFHNQLSENIF